MKRIVPAVVSSSILALAMPSIAVAAHHHARHHARHARHVHGKRASVITLGTLAPTPAPATPTPAPPTPKASAPTTPAPCTPEQVGTVVSFENENLTIELCDKSTYTGEVTEGTEVKCRTEEREPEKVHHDEDSELTRGEGPDEDDCSTTLVAGAKIYGAELAFTSFGPIWEKVGLLE